MSKSGKGFWAILAAALIVFVLASAGIVAFQPRMANHFGYALPGPNGLPYRIAYQGRTYVNLSMCAGAAWCKSTSSAQPLCVTQAALANDNRWPLKQIGSIFTLFGPSHAVLVDPADEGLTQLDLFVADGTDCYIVYTLQGGP
jgi:hypothetical protein